MRKGVTTLGLVSKSMKLQQKRGLHSWFQPFFVVSVVHQSVPGTFAKERSSLQLDLTQRQKIFQKGLLDNI